jgi:glycosyltransferase involved in cell wall biosynthesis
MKDALRLGPSLVHLHVSEIGNPMPLLLGVPVLSRLAPVMITVHSGGFPARVAGSNVLFKVFLGDSIRRATHVIAVSELIGAALIEHFRVRKEIISVIPAFLRPPGNGYSPSRSEAGVFLASGYGAQVYFWEGLLEAAKTVTGIRELVLVFYTHYERPYFDVVLEKAQGKFPFKVTIRKDLSEEEFLAELARCSVFVRPTFADGDSLALREALALGKTVVASDAVPRPPSCILFRTGDSNDLRTKLTLATSQPAEKNLLVEDFSESLLTLYADVIQRFSKVSSAS